MKAVEFETQLSNNTILIPQDFQLELSLSKDKYVRVIVLMDEHEKDDEAIFENITRKKFLEGYDEVDSVYDSL